MEYTVYIIIYEYTQYIFTPNTLPDERGMPSYVSYLVVRNLLTPDMNESL